MDYVGFVSKLKCFIVAPAGYGKTHAIAECLKYVKGRQLILTHTHAGVASLKEKIQHLGVSADKYRVETISSYAQKHVNAFYCGKDIPDQEDGSNYYPFIIDKAINLLEITPIQDVVKATYMGLFVDEYQDCNIRQHRLVKTLAKILPTRLFGDQLQGIFDFNGDILVDFDKDLNEFERFPDLSVPWRWKDNNPGLGECFKKIREIIEKKGHIDLDSYKKHIEVIKIEESDKYNYRSEYNKRIWELSNEDNLLIIHPDGSNLNVRKDFTSRFNNAFDLVEAIDNKDFYLFAKRFDNTGVGNIYRTIYDLIPDLFNGDTSRNKWFNDKGVKDKRSKTEKELSLSVSKEIEHIKTKGSFSSIARLLKHVKRLSGIKCYRPELLWELCSALEYAEHKNITVYEAMKEMRNRKRRNGRKIEGRNIGTTLLTKGLEFSTVAILDAHRFKCPKNLYVAITRASKKLIIFTSESTLYPYSINN